MLERVQMVLRMVNGNGGQMAPPHLGQKSSLMKNSNSSSYLDGLESAWVRHNILYFNSKFNAHKLNNFGLCVSNTMSQIQFYISFYV